jgi:hypothetical protein
MCFPFGSGSHPATFNDLVKIFRSTVERFPDERTGDNVQHSMADAAISDLCPQRFLAADPIHTARLTGSIFTASLFGIIVVLGKSSRCGALLPRNHPN